MSLMAESGCLEQVDRGADNPTSYYNYHEARKEGQGPIWAVAPLMMMIKSSYIIYREVVGDIIWSRNVNNFFIQIRHSLRVTTFLL
jgi:hypothetical protein